MDEVEEVGGQVRVGFLRYKWDRVRVESAAGVLVKWGYRVGEGWCRCGKAARGEERLVGQVSVGENWWVGRLCSAAEN